MDAILAKNGLLFVLERKKLHIFDLLTAELVHTAQNVKSFAVQKDKLLYVDTMPGLKCLALR
jgi:hypothetical protein